MKLDHIKIEGFKSIRQIDLDLKSLNVLIGPNGSGKSNFISIFKLLAQLVDGKLQLYVNTSGGADSLLYLGSKITNEIKIELTYDWNQYKCTLVPTADNSLVFSREVFAYHDKQHYTQPWAKNLGAGHKESLLSEEVEMHTGRAAEYVLKGIKSSIIYHFHDTSESAGVKRPCDINDNAYLRNDAGNLAAFLYMLKGTSHRNYETVVNQVRMAAPFFDDFVLRPMPENPNKIRLEWLERGSDHLFQAYHLSDGTLRFICLVTLLLQPNLPSTIVIDEPELGLHPFAINQLAALMQSACKRDAQIIVSTQSVTLVNQFQPDDLLVVGLKDKETTIEKIDLQRLSKWIGEYSLGELWEKNVFGGRPL